MTLLHVVPVPMSQTSLSHPSNLHPPDMAATVIIPPPFRQSSQSSHPRLQRPKLSINTQQTRTFGKGSSLRLETLSAASPTARNTFQNAYETNRVQIVSTPLRQAHDATETPNTPEPADSRTPSSSSVSSASTLSDLGGFPYTITHNTSSILVNSPIPRIEHRRLSISQSRPIFPPERHVAFRSPLEEEVRTTKYTWKHSDIETEESTSVIEVVESSPKGTIAISSIAQTLHSNNSTESSCASPDLEQTPTTPTAFTESALSSPPPSAVRLSYRRRRSRLKVHSPKAGDKRDSSSESDSDSCPETPVAGRRKRRREWVWTLGPVRGEGEAQNNTLTEEADASDLTDDGSASSLTSERSSSFSYDHSDSTPASSRKSSEGNVEAGIAAGCVDQS